MFEVALMSVKRINVYLFGGSLYCPFCGREINYEESCEHVIFIACKLGDLPEYYVDELVEMLEREPSRGNDLLFIYASNKFREVYERVYGKSPAFDQIEYVERGSIKIEDAVNLLESSFRSKSDIILFEVLVREPPQALMDEYVEFIALLKED
jgi:hypothetical protein